jgi:hypothetical protein
MAICPGTGYAYFYANPHALAALRAQKDVKIFSREDVGVLVKANSQQLIAKSHFRLFFNFWPRVNQPLVIDFRRYVLVEQEDAAAQHGAEKGDPLRHQRREGRDGQKMLKRRLWISYPILLDFKANLKPGDLEKFRANPVQQSGVGWLLVLIMMQINSVCKNQFYSKYRRLISIQRFFKNFRNRSETFIETFINPTKKNLNKLIEVMQSVIHKSLFEVRKRKTTEQELLDLGLIHEYLKP